MHGGREKLELWTVETEDDLEAEVAALIAESRQADPDAPNWDWLGRGGRNQRAAEEKVRIVEETYRLQPRPQNICRILYLIRRTASARVARRSLAMMAWGSSVPSSPALRAPLCGFGA
jgi:hypothetical protein